ncbi:GntR family transcriptional regulator [Amycolatopsis echigonensis]|uniref:GntR family transcriptional regulator n=1 Tax=Amycolatopsis echigonensis TaxID=2576905 RepID=A0A2N3WQ20_9PSEU|nr:MULTISPECIES: GntR family transcriptional regulator [Amycolatopsis]MBB2504443.1 GntR family transcriptional regulator [Amycolatopsis echigonensis]PKV95964.1 GntR family transcriptional regulator [Amycolatopsis niigatensis]
MGEAELVRTGGQPLWRQLQQRLLVRIRAGEFDSAFPGELALADEYSVSRQTVRQALRELRADGTLIAERGRQPRVAAAAEIQQPLGALYSLFAAVEEAGLDQHSVVRRLDIRADAVVAERLSLEGSTPLLYLERLRLAGNDPLAVDRVWLPADLARPLLDADFQHTSLYGELHRRTGVRLDHGEEQIRAVVPTRAERTLLGCGETVGAFSIGRLGTSAGKRIEWRHTLVRGDRFALTAEFSGRTGYRLVTTGALAGTR